MPLPPPDRPVLPPIVMLESPREAAERARVYRRRGRREPRERWLRIAALVGSLLVHFTFLIGVVLGPAYVPNELPDHPGEALEVRFIEKKVEPPPPPPPVRGTPPRKRGPVHRGRTASVSQVSPPRANAAALPSIPALAPIPVPTLQPPVIEAKLRPAMPKPDKVVVAPPPPLTLPAPAPTPELQPVPLAGEPPTVTLDTPPVAKPVPPKFQPEPARKPQAEGNRPILPPPSLAMPELPAQSPPKIAPPTVAMEARVPVSDVPASVVAVTPVPQPAAPPVPDLQPVPLPAQVAPTVNLEPQVRPKAPVVAVERAQIQAPALQVDEPRLEAVPLAPLAPTLIEQPRQAAPEAPKLTPPAPKVEITLARPELVPSPATPDIPPAESAAPAEAASQAAPPADTASAEPARAETVANQAPADQRDVSSAPDATPQGSDTATPGSPEGVVQSPPLIGKDGSIVLPAPARGSNEAGTPGDQGDRSGNRSGEGAAGGKLGGYIQLKPHGDTEIMEHRAPNIGYKPTRFEQDWAPEGESSIDTALRHAVEKTTVKHTFHLPRGVRIECVAMPLFPMALFGCGNPDPPAKALEPEIYERLNLPSAPLAPPPPPAPSASASAPAAPVMLDNSVQCATARVAGSPPPPGCVSSAPPAPLQPARSSSSWVPASDQFH